MTKENLSLEPLSTSSRWRKFWGTNQEANSTSCERAKKALEENEAFHHEMQKNMTADERRSLQHATADSLDDLLSICLDDAKVQQDRRQRSQTVVKRAGKKTVVFASNFASFLQAYSGIVEIMQGADQQYGGAAYATLSLLLIVGVNKQRKEERIDATLLDLQREFLRIQILKDIHPTERMKTSIADAYRLGIEFAREATRYYSRSSSRRVLEAFTKPPSLGIDERIAAIAAAMIKIDTERDDSDSQRLSEVQQQVEEVQKHVEEVQQHIEEVQQHVEEVQQHVEEVQRGVDDVRKSLRDSQVQLETERLGTLRRKYLLGKPDPQMVLEQYSSNLKEAFKNPGRLRNLNIDQILDDNAFARWENANASSMILLHGTTAIKKGDYSWISPAVSRLIARYRDQHKSVFFHLCHDSAFMEQDTPLQVIFSSLIYQFLEANPSVLHETSMYQELCSKFSDAEQNASPAQTALDVLKKLLDMLPETYLLLDRVDRIKGKASSFMGLLVKLIRESRGKTKILLVASSNLQVHPEGKMTVDLLESVEEDLGPERFLRLRLDQR
ncbi:MAG: hypothetical protein L6R39_004752 [Caloplaca ligustica]|nr:MAG: hypothetical protein L6R39_004752 [Caloplaca ligustica]